MRLGCGGELDQPRRQLGENAVALPRDIARVKRREFYRDARAAGELAFGMSVENTSDWMMPSDVFWKRWNGQSTIYMLTKRGTYDALHAAGHKNIYLIAGTDDNVLAVNKEMTP